MNEYFQLQFKMLNRKMIEFGLPLLIGYTVLPLMFILLSNYLFSKSEFATYLYGFIIIGFVSKLGEPKRNDFLKTIFSKIYYLKVRAIENLLCALPFLIYLCYQNEFLVTLVLLSGTVFISLFNFKTTMNYTIPTPFGKKPFEFAIGFRKAFFVFPIAYFLTYISIKVSNFNLGIFSMFLIGIICFSFYTKIENEYYVWSFKLSSKDFLIEKIKRCLINFTFLVTPIIIAVSIFFYNEIDILIVFLVLCYLYLITIIVAKYSSFPNEMNMSQGILITVSFLFPPLIMVLIPLFYAQSIRSLNTILK